MLTTKGNFRDETGEVSLASLTAPLVEHLDALSTFLDQRVEDFEIDVQELVRYTFQHSGKRLRPLLVFMTGYDGPNPKPDLVKAAAVVELVHLATLVHDDILDDANIRHKVPTVVVEHGAHVAVLLGDALFAEALRLASEYPTPEVCRAVALATRRVCAGEIGQTFQRGNDQLSLDEYMRVIEMKTADLFAVSCYLGGLLGGEGVEFARAAETFGRHLGIAYQIFDDVADLLGDEARIGKTLGTDLASGKFTLPILYLLEGKTGAERSVLVQRLRGGITPAALERMLDQEQIVSRVVDAFNAQLDLAAAALQPFHHLAAVAPLAALEDFVRQQMHRYRR